ncbi:MAG: hypothetical protein ACTH31_16130 [Pseudoclavibacter sp.]
MTRASDPWHRPDDAGAAPSPGAPRSHVNWAIIVGLGALSLAWPLSGVLGFEGLVRAVVLISATVALFVGVVGFGRVPRPVLTLTLAGLAYGLIHLISTMFVQPLAIFSVWTIVPLAGVGALLGLAAMGVQRAMGVRS